MDAQNFVACLYVSDDMCAAKPCLGTLSVLSTSHEAFTRVIIEANFADVDFESPWAVMAFGIMIMKAWRVALLMSWQGLQHAHVSGSFTPSARRSASRKTTTPRWPRNVTVSGKTGVLCAAVLLTCPINQTWPSLEGRTELTQHPSPTPPSSTTLPPSQDHEHFPSAAHRRRPRPEGRVRGSAVD
jgi:hypothetical protein